MVFGLIKWFDIEKGFGIIASTDEDNKEIFFHKSQWNDTENFIASKKIPLAFTANIQRNKLSATNCKYFQFNNKDHWEYFFNILGKSDNIKIEHQNFNITELILNSIPENFNFSIIENNIDELAIYISEEELINRPNLFQKILDSTNSKQLKEYIFKKLNKKLLSLKDENQILLFNKQLYKDFIPSKEILLSNQQFIDSKLLNKINDSETINLILLKKLNELEVNFDINQFFSFTNLIPLITSENFKNIVIEKLNINIGNTYKEYIINKIKQILTLSGGNFYELKKVLNEHPTFINEITLGYWRQDFTEVITKFASIDLTLELWQSNIIQNIENYILFNLEKFKTKHFEIVIRNQSISKELKHKILDINLFNNHFEFVLSSSQKFYPELHSRYDTLVFEKIEHSTYFELWRKGYGKILPIEYLIDYFDIELKKYIEINSWISQGIIQKEEILSVLVKILQKISSVSNRNDFYTKYNCIKKYSLLNEGDIDDILALHDSFNSLIIWHLGLNEAFDLNLLKKKFVYFNPDDQVYIFKRLFYLKHIKQIDFTFDDLDKILRADVDLFLLNEQFNNDFVLDISTHTIIEGIKRFQTKGNFLFESDLILKDLKNNTNKKFKIENYFEKCNGRMTAEWNWNSKGKIKEVKFPNNPNLFYYSIDFPSSFEAKGRNYYGTYTYREKNPNFEFLKDEIKKLPKAKWNPDEKHWGVPSAYKNEVFIFAQKNRFFIELENKKHYDNNLHLVEYSKNNKDGEANLPNGLCFCEGRKSKIPHAKFNKEFWWCVNEPCFLNNETNHLDSQFIKEVVENKKEWEYYTLLDILRILEINLDEHKTNPVDYVKDGHYYKFIGHINAFNRLVEKLYCLECSELLYPTESSHFALYRDVRFHCENEKCNKYKKVVYLNRCLNGECSNIVDSRVSKQCSLKLFICDICGTCCSFDMFKRRLENLKLVGGYIHPELVENVELQKGHLERAEYYCYKCKKMTTELDENHYKCLDCNIEYNLQKYKWLSKKWTMKYYRRKDYPSQNRNHSSDNEDDLVTI